MTKQPLNERLKTLRKVTAPTLDPFPHEETRKVPEILPDIQEVFTDSKIVNALTPLILQDAELGLEESEIKRQRRPIRSKIKKLIGSAAATKFMCGENRVTLYEAPRPKISPVILHSRLVKLGLTSNEALKLIADSTVTTIAMTLKITAPGNGSEEEEEE